MFEKVLNQEINAELVATFVFAVVSGLFLFLENGASAMVDDLFKWMFPASVMVFLTLLIVKTIEHWHNRATSRYRYVDLRRKD